MKKILFLLTAALVLLLTFGCPIPVTPDTPDPTPTPTPSPEPAGLSAWEAWFCFQLSTGGENGDLYSLWASNETGCKLNRQGMITNPSGYWNLTYNAVCGKQYQDGDWQRSIHSDNYGNYVPLNQLLNVCSVDEYDSWEAVQIADANGGSEYAEIRHMNLASGNGGIFGTEYVGRTFWVVSYKWEIGNSQENWFLIDAQTGQFVKRF